MIAVLGAGPAGLTAAYELTRHGQPCVVLEQGSQVGGLSRTVEHNGYLFDIGGHRFYTAVPLIEKIWTETLDEDMLVRPRLSRIYYRQHFFQYPLEPMNVVRGLGPVEVFRCGLSYAFARFRKRGNEKHFEEWVSNRFGKRLFEIFFRTYTEKVWGIPCDEIGAEWAAQRIRGLSFGTLVKQTLLSGRKPVRSLIKEFLYPRRGPGMMWDRMRARVEKAGGRVLTDHPVEAIEMEDGRVAAVRAGGQRFEVNGVISTLALGDLLPMVEPPPPQPALRAAAGLRYRDFLTVALMVRGRGLFPDNWIYIHEPGVKVGRIQNYTNWSPEMVPDPEMSCLGMEYFCFEGDGLWTSSDEQLGELARREIASLGLVDPARIEGFAVVRVPKAYPMYDGAYRDHRQTLGSWFRGIPNLEAAGRNGLHRYDNQDHAMLSGIMAARNLIGGHFDLFEWQQNDYLEDAESALAAEWAKLEATQPAVPKPISGSGDAVR
ncbi:MAG: NAD(P)/FAD-dependent oxidoreductase [Bryobacteraceae bacterium]|nr:NAD(P)/FAD-dependent oxidoreductase [Bryobacteraceae bacterium]